MKPINNQYLKKKCKLIWCWQQNKLAHDSTVLEDTTCIYFVFSGVVKNINRLDPYVPISNSNFPRTEFLVPGYIYIIFSTHLPCVKLIALARVIKSILK